MLTRPYPYDRLPKLTRDQLAASAALRDAWELASLEAALVTARALLGHDLQFELGTPEFCAAEQAATRLESRAAALVLLLEHVQSTLPVPWLLEVSAYDAQHIVDRALGGDGTEAPAPSLLPLDELSRGALAYVAARVLAALGGELTLRDIAALPIPRAALPTSGCVVWPLWLRPAHAPQRLTLRLYIPNAFTPKPPSRRVRRAPVHDVSALPLTLIALAGRTCLQLSAAKALQRGDVVVLDDTSLVYAEGQFGGHVSAQFAGSASSITCSVGDTGLTITAFTRNQEPRMTTGRLQSSSARTGDETASGPEFAADAVLDIALEVARFSVTLAELEHLQPGDVLSTGRRIGDRVSLRVSGQAFAEGELVDVEGEVGVRILSFSVPKPALSEP